MRPAPGTGKPVRSLEMFEMFVKGRGGIDPSEPANIMSVEKGKGKLPEPPHFLRQFEYPQERQTLPPIALGLLRFPGKLRSRMASERALLPVAR
jgi:hypothetical protein